jgi:hypothetical protein
MEEESAIPQKNSVQGVQKCSKKGAEVPSNTHAEFKAGEF